MPESNTRLDRILARVVDETITPDEFVELESILDENPDAQQRYCRYLGLHSDLVQLKTDNAESGQSIKAASPSAWRIAILPGIAAAAVVSLASIALLRPTGPPDIGTVSEVDGFMRWTEISGEVVENLEAGRDLAGGTLELLGADSWAEIEFIDGTVVSVSGRSVITLSERDGQKVLRLREGNLSIDATPQPADSPMLIVTPSAETKVLGTQLNISADSFSTRVTVNEGRVSVKRLADGSVQEVAADHLVVAALEQRTDFLSVQRPEFSESWQSEFPRDALQGEWIPGTGENPGSLHARPHLWRGERGLRKNPVLLYSAVMNPSPGVLPPVRLSKDARFLIRGRLERSHWVHFGFATHHPHGGFSGKYSGWREIKLEQESGGEFEIELALDEFKRKREFFPKSPAGHEINYFWIQTVEADAGLEILGADLIPVN